MTKQAKSGKHPIHTLPEDIQKSLESFWEPITSASYCGNFVTTDGGRVICVPTFVVNKTRYVYVIDALDGLYTYEDITSRQERQSRAVVFRDRYFEDNVRQKRLPRQRRRSHSDRQNAGRSVHGLPCFGKGSVVLCGFRDNRKTC